MRTFLSLATVFSGATALLPIISDGNKFYQLQEDGTKSPDSFTIIGVDYQPGGSSGFDANSGKDVLSDANTCLRDFWLLSQIGVNTIRVYTVSPWTNHDECMSIANALGIYVILDASSPYIALNRDDPASSYNSNLLNWVFGQIDAFKGYPNMLGLFAGNEVVNDGSSASKAPKYVRALQRDMKNYVKLHANRSIPIGYSAADDDVWRVAMWDYLECGNSTSKSDFYGINSYDWCSGSSDWQSSGYGNIATTFENSSIPLFFSEFGCNKNTPRTFTEIGAVYGPDQPNLANVLSGGLIYEYSNEANNYGLVDIDSDGNVQLRQDYSNLKDALSKIDYNSTTLSDNSPSTPQQCDNSSLPSGASQFSFDLDLPDCPDENLLSQGGGNQNTGSLVDVASYTSISATIVNNSSSTITPTISFNSQNLVNSQTRLPSSSYSGGSVSTSSSSPSSQTSHSTASSSAASSASKSTSSDAAAHAGAQVSVCITIAALILSLI